MTHLMPDELIDAAEGLLSDERRSHLAACEQCQRGLAGLSSALTEAKQVSVPEPSPLFWPNFSQRVRVAIDQDAATANNWPAWLRWQVLLPLGALAMIILVVMISMPNQNSVAPDVSAALDARDAPDALDAPDAPDAPDALDAPVTVDNWVMLADLVGDIDLDTASAAGVTLLPGDAEQAVLHLTAEEQQELTRLLKAELTRAKS
jgi:hypothetical protein